MPPMQGDDELSCGRTSGLEQGLGASNGRQAGRVRRYRQSRSDTLLYAVHKGRVALTGVLHPIPIAVYPLLLPFPFFFSLPSLDSKNVVQSHRSRPQCQPRPVLGNTSFPRPIPPTSNWHQHVYRRTLPLHPFRYVHSSSNRIPRWVWSHAMSHS